MFSLAKLSNEQKNNVKIHKLAASGEEFFDPATSEIFVSAEVHPAQDHIHSSANMGLAGRKDKRLDPRNLTWSDDKSRFSYQHMKNLGWRDSSGIGRDLEGNPNHIAVAKRVDNAGIGAGKKDEGSDVRGQSFEEVLRRLTGSASASPAPEAAVSVAAVEAAGEVKVVARVAHKHRQSKKMITSSPAALAEILGVPVGSITPTSTPASPSPLASAPSTPLPEASAPIEKNDDPTDISTSTLSVQDYFRAKMKERARLLQQPRIEEGILEKTVEVEASDSAVASGSSTPLPDETRAMSKAEAKAAKKARKEAKAKRKAELLEDNIPPPSALPPSPVPDPVPVSRDITKAEAREAKRARKEEKEAKREAKRLKKASTGGT